MKNELKRLSEQISKLTAANEELSTENKKLREQNEYLIRQLFGRKSEKLDPRQLLFVLGLDEQDDMQEAEPEPPPAEESSSKPPRKRRPIKDRLPDNLPVETVIIDPPEVKADPESYRCIGEEVSTELCMTSPRYYIRKTVRRKYVRKDDREQPPVIAPSEPRLIDNSFASPELLVDIILKKYTEHLPLYRQEQTLNQRYGIEISRKTMANWMWRVGNWLQNIWEAIKEELRASGYLQIDETPVRYLDPGTGLSHIGYLWAYYVKGVGVVYEWHCSRGADSLEEMLSCYSGDLQCDGYKVYWTFNERRENEEARYQIYACWAHARRYFFNAKDESELAAAVLVEIQKLYRIERELRDAGASDEERAERRHKESKPILNTIKKMLDEGLTEHRPKSLTGRAIAYTLNLWEELERYADTGHVEIDNNLVENAIRPTAIGKKNWLFFGSPDSGWQSAIIYSILETCKMLGIDQKEYLLDVLRQLPKLTAKEARQLTPSRWLAKRTESIA